MRETDTTVSGTVSPSSQNSNTGNKKNRAVAVHTAVMTEVLKKLYGAQALLDEMSGKK